MTKTEAFDVVSHLSDPERQVGYLEAAFEDGDPAVIAAAIGDVIRARGATDVSRAADLRREAIYKAFTMDGNPTLSTLMRVLKVLGIALRPQRAA